MVFFCSASLFGTSVCHLSLECHTVPVKRRKTHISKDLHFVAHTFDLYEMTCKTYASVEVKRKILGVRKEFHCGTF